MEKMDKITFMVKCILIIVLVTAYFKFYVKMKKIEITNNKQNSHQPKPMCAAFEKSITFSARGSIIVLYDDSAIFYVSTYLNSISNRWCSDQQKIHYLDIDPISFHFLINYCAHNRESQAHPSKLNEELTKLYNEKFTSNPEYLSGATYLEINFNLNLDLLRNDDWDCQNSHMSILNMSVKFKEWHYVDCIVYIAYMLREKKSEFLDIHLFINGGLDDDTPKKTQLSCVSLTISLPHEKDQPMESHTLIFGVNTHGSYSNQHSTICYKSLEQIIENIKQIKCHDKIKEFCENIIKLIPGYNNIALRKI
tara:strand:- start:2994 stop:3917 length:924 start_codon:yes stop_codon:yes gene_type:complete